MQILQMPTTEPPSTDTRINLSGLNWLRVFAALGVVWLHACVPYLSRPMPGLDWPVKESSSQLLDFSFWTVEVFVMPVFLVIAGMLAWRSLNRHGASALLTSRVKRLGKPLLFGLCVILPMDLYIWLAGWVYEGWIEPVKVKSLKIDGPLGENLWGTSHLWFLLYLLTYVAALAGTARFASRNPIHRFARARYAVPVALVVIGMVTLCVRPNVVWGFQHAFLPVPSKWIYSATFFVGGVWLSRKSIRIESVISIAPRLAGLAVVLLLAGVMQGRWHLNNHDPNTAISELAGVSLAVLTTLSAWTFTLAAIGISLRTSTRTPNAISYLAAASFWIYLVHHPLLGLVHIDLKYLLPGVTSSIKGVLSFSIAVGASLLTYESFIRKTRLGNWLGMQWSIPAVTHETTVISIPDQEASDDRRIAA